jgi:uncharacterized membrane protein
MRLAYYAKLYLLTVPVFLAVDLVWLGFIAKDFYRTNLGYVLSAQVNWAPAITFYLLYIVGVLIFAVAPAIRQASVLKALLYGALFGFFTYMTYELTNMATIAHWPLKVVVIDILWGMMLSAIVAAISYYIGRWLG